MIKMVYKIKVIKIVSKKVYHEECSICNRKLKRALITDNGVMGFRCFLTEIGVPTKKKNVLNIDDLPEQVFEDIAEEYIKKLEEVDPEKFSDLVINPDIKLEYPILYRSRIHFKYFPKDSMYHKMQIKNWIEVSLLGLLYRLKDIINIPSSILNKIINTNIMNSWLKKQMEIANKNKNGLPKKEFIKNFS